MASESSYMDAVPMQTELHGSAAHCLTVLQAQFCKLSSVGKKHLRSLSTEKKSLLLYSDVLQLRYVKQWGIS